MFGYIIINRQELKVKDLELYEAYYCGLCKQIRKRHGLLPASALNFDMTFLEILLASLYEEEKTVAKNKCMLHPITRKNLIITKSGEYAADMNFMLAYHNLMDDWIDEHNLKARFLAAAFHKDYKKMAAQYPRQHKAFVRYVKQLHKCEKSGYQDVERAATLTGEALAEIYVSKEDVWAPALRQMGFYLGKFIYLMDAYEDVERDIAYGNYNPFIPLYESGELQKKAEEYLKLLMGGCCRAFEVLPILENTDLLRNILYSGVWMKFASITNKRCRKAEGKKKDGSI